MRTARVVLTGSSGFVGKKLLQILLSNDYDVLAIDKDLASEIPNNISCLSIDLVHASTDELAKLFKDSIVIHLAAISTSVGCENNPSLALQVNVDLTKKIVDAVSIASAKLIFASSEWVYPQKDRETRYSEDTELRLDQETNFYTMTKIVGEWIVQRYCMDSCILRFGIIYGERQVPQSAVESMTQLAIDSQDIEVGSLETARRFIHVEDVSRGIIQVLEDFENARNKIFNLAGDRLVSLRDIADILRDTLGRSLSVKAGKGITSIRNPDVQLFYSTFNWKPRINIEEGVKRLVLYLTNQSRGI